MKIKFLGTGGAFAPLSVGNSNMLLTSESGKRLIFDVGTTAPYILRDEWGVDFREIDGIYISHTHSDHAGGLEQFAFSRYFLPAERKPKLYANSGVMKELWEKTLFGGLSRLEGKMMNLTDYFECISIEEGKSFDWEGWNFETVKTLHIDSGYDKMFSYGLYATKHGNEEFDYIPSFFISSDSKFNPEFERRYLSSDIIFQECETLPTPSKVHTHYNELDYNLTLDIKEKMWLYHYSNQISTYEEDGFAGFVSKGQEFEI